MNLVMDKENVLYIYNLEYYSAIKKNSILPFVTTWMALEDIMLSERAQTEKDEYCKISLICEKTSKSKKQTHR